MSGSLPRLVAFTTASFTVIAAGPAFLAVEADTEDSGNALAKINRLGRISGSG